MSFPLFDNQGARHTASGGAFSPSDLSNMLCWFEGDTVTMGTGTNVDTWDDISGNNNDAPLRIQSPQRITNSLNGHDVIDFTPPDGFNLISAITNSIGTNNITAFFVVNVDSASTGIDPAFELGYFNDDEFGISYDNTGGEWFYLHHPTSGTGVDSSGAPSKGTWHLVTIYRDGTTRSIQINNGTAQTDTGADDLFTNNMTGRIGGSASGGAFFDGKIAEIILYNTKHSASDITSVNDYLNTKYSLY